MRRGFANRLNPVFALVIAIPATGILVGLVVLILASALDVTSAEPDGRPLSKTSWQLGQ